MARNKFDIDETLETPFDIRHLKRALKYAGKYKKRIFLSLFVSILAAVISLLSPLIVQYAVDNCMKGEETIPMLIGCAGVLLASIVVSVFLAQRRSKMMTKVGQDIILNCHTGAIYSKILWKRRFCTGPFSREIKRRISSRSC